METNNDMVEATTRMIMIKHRLTRKEAQKYVAKALDGGFGPYAQNLMKGACGYK